MSRAVLRKYRLKSRRGRRPKDRLGSSGRYGNHRTGTSPRPTDSAGGLSATNTVDRRLFQPGARAKAHDQWRRPDRQKPGAPKRSARMKQRRELQPELFAPHSLLRFPKVARRAGSLPCRSTRRGGYPRVKAASEWLLGAWT